VEWAEGKSDGDQTTVKSLHVSNLPENCTEEKLTATFTALGGVIEKVAMMDAKPGDVRKRNFAFVHFDKRSTALKVLEVCPGSGRAL
jgi:RNA recognition motif-containing protein